MTTLAHPYDGRFAAAVTQSPSPSPVFPPGRYGRRRDPALRRRRRWVSYALATLVMIGGVGIAIKLYQQYAEAPYQVRIISVTNLTDTQVTVLFEVHKPAGLKAVCTVLGHTRDGEQVGIGEVEVPAGTPDETTTQVTYTLATTKRPVTAEVPGCGPTHS
jgi:Domain of unknown function (DUF4307)